MQHTENRWTDPDSRKENYASFLVPTIKSDTFIRLTGTDLRFSDGDTTPDEGVFALEVVDSTADDGKQPKIIPFYIFRKEAGEPPYAVDIADPKQRKPIELSDDHLASAQETLQDLEKYFGKDESRKLSEHEERMQSWQELQATLQKALLYAAHTKVDDFIILTGNSITFFGDYGEKGGTDEKERVELEVIIASDEAIRDQWRQMHDGLAPRSDDKTIYDAPRGKKELTDFAITHMDGCTIRRTSDNADQKRTTDTVNIGRKGSPYERIILAGTSNDQKITKATREITTMVSKTEWDLPQLV